MENFIFCAVQLERNVANNAQYYQREYLEVNPVALEQRFRGCKAISLTENEIIPYSLHVCHHMKSKKKN